MNMQSPVVHDATTLPKPTRDITRVKGDLAAFGYGILENALSAEELAVLRERTLEQAAGERAHRLGTFDGGGANQRLFFLVNKGRVFRDLVLHPLVDTFMSHLLGRDWLLSSLTANIAGPGGQPMYLHQDQGYVGWTPKPMVANILFLLGDFTKENGGTLLAPGSHVESHHSPEIPPSRLISAEAPAGSALVFEGRLWHGTGSNVTKDERRPAILMYCCKPYIRSQENFTLGLDRDILRAERPALLARLGFMQNHGLGRINNVIPREYPGVMPWEQRPMGPLHDDGTPKAE
ncbi:MAG: phytanoyl-CoA dioxygenase family protein [Alphaproteobacteria bacterium]|nr:phytanoyl-CoA dioxygenase family protein [Alphaproteobacteria bacterium]